MSVSICATQLNGVVHRFDAGSCFNFVSRCGAPLRRLRHKRAPDNWGCAHRPAGRVRALTVADSWKRTGSECLDGSQVLWGEGKVHRLTRSRQTVICCDWWGANMGTWHRIPRTSRRQRHACGCTIVRITWHIWCATSSIRRSVYLVLEMRLMSARHRRRSHRVVRRVDTRVMLLMTAHCLLGSRLLFSPVVDSDLMCLDLSDIRHRLPRLGLRLATLVDQLINLNVKMTNSTCQVRGQYDVDSQAT